MNIAGFAFCSTCVGLVLVSIMGLPNTQAQPVVLMTDTSSPEGEVQITAPASSEVIPPATTNDTGIKMVMVDQAQLDASAKATFTQYVAENSASFPPTPVMVNGTTPAQCSYFRKPQIWCLLLNGGDAQKVHNQLKQQTAFANAVGIRDVRRLVEPNSKRPKS